MNIEDSKEERPNISSYKGLLPPHMKQGLPPFLQVLFAARPPAPFLPPIQKPYKLKIKGFCEGIDYKSLLSKEKNLNFDVNCNNSNVNGTQKHYYNNFRVKPFKSKELEFEEKLKKHIVNKREEYKIWKENSKYSNENKSGDPFKTLIISNLVD